MKTPFAASSAAARFTFSRSNGTSEGNAPDHAGHSKMSTPLAPAEAPTLKPRPAFGLFGDLHDTSPHIAPGQIRRHRAVGREFARCGHTVTPPSLTGTEGSGDQLDTHLHPPPKRAGNPGERLQEPASRFLRGRISNTMTTETTATLAKVPKMKCNGTL